MYFFGSRKLFIKCPFSFFFNLTVVYQQKRISWNQWCFWSRNRSPQPLSEASPWVTRISGDDLEQRQIYNLSDALRSVPGMALVRTVQIGSQTSLFSRGAQSDHVSFLYEGRKLNGVFPVHIILGNFHLMAFQALRYCVVPLPYSTELKE